jgi:hypothetical protein
MEAEWVCNSNNDIELKMYNGVLTVAIIREIADGFMYAFDEFHDPACWDWLDSKSLEEAKKELLEMRIVSFKDEIDYCNEVISQITMQL